MNDELLRRREQAMGSAYRLFYERPVTVVRGEGVWLIDDKGQRYLDVYNNVPHVGHCHPGVVAAVSRQLSTLNTHTRYLHEGIVRYAERLLARMPGAINRAMFACSGTEAVELALRLARAFTGGDGIIVLSNAYHGNSWAVAQISPDLRGAERGPHVVTIDVPDGYRAERDNDPVATVREALDRLAGRNIRPAALVIDTVLSSEGIVRLPHGYLAAMAQEVRSAGAVFIADEVQAGFGRPGHHFWGFEWQGAEPDLVTMGKPMGNGFPVSAVAARHDIVDAFSNRTAYFNTFGGNPVAAAAANAVLDAIEEEGLQENAREVGDYLLARLRDLAGEFDCIGDVRGSGLFIGVDLVGNPETRRPAPDLCTRAVNALRERHILVGMTGREENVLKLRPPMVFSRANADQLLDELQQVLAGLDAATSRRQ